MSPLGSNPSPPAIVRESHEQLRHAFEQGLPERFDMATSVCERWADGGDRRALTSESATGETRRYSFDDLDRRASRLADHLADQGVGRGDRVGVTVLRKPERIITHVACWKLVAVWGPASGAFSWRACVRSRHRAQSEVRPIRRSTLPSARTDLVLYAPSTAEDGLEPSPVGATREGGVSAPVRAVAS